MGVSLVVAVTDGDWFEMLRSQPNLAEVNFWAPSAVSFRALQPGELFLFKLHAPRNVIVGGGIFAYANALPCSLAWEAFREANVSKIDVEAARKLAKQLFGKIAEGKDPALEKAVARTAQGNTFGVQASEYLSVLQTRVKPRSLVETQRFLTRYWRPLHGLSLSGITRATVAARLRVLAKDHGPVAADRARAALSAFFSWAIGEGLCDQNPVIGTNKAAGEYRARERVLTDHELAAIWNALPDNDYGNIIRLLSLTGCRRDEIGSLRWSEIDLDGRLIALPGERTKNGQPHEVPLSALALSVLERLPRRPGRDLVFGRGKGGYSGWSRAKKGLDKKLSIPHWTLHDLRRTAATRMADIGIQPHVIEAVLNHVSGHKAGVAGVYNRSNYEAEKRKALDALGQYIQVVLAKANGTNVSMLNIPHRAGPSTQAT